MRINTIVRASLCGALCLVLMACGEAASPPTATAPATTPTPQAAALPTPAETSAPSPEIVEDPLAAIAAHLGRDLNPAEEQWVVEKTQGPYARVVMNPTFGDGAWFFLQKSPVGGWFVLTSVGMIAQPELSTVRAMGVPEELLSDLSGTAPPADGAAPVWTRELSLQPSLMDGDDVRILQARLLTLGYTEVGSVDGVFGQKTQLAVLNFQARNDLMLDGIVGEQTWNQLFNPVAITADHPTIADGTLEVAFDATMEFPPEARVYLIRLDGRGYIAADMPEQPAGQPFTIDAPPGFYSVYARSMRFEDISFFGLWDAEAEEAPALAWIAVRPGQKTGPLELLRAPDPCSERFVLPESPDQIFSATNTSDYRMRLNCP